MMIFPAPMTAPPTPLLRVLSPNDGRRVFISARTLLAVICVLALFTGGCKSTKAAQVNIQKICSFQLTGGDSSVHPQERDWNLDLDECVIIMDTENGEDNADPE